VCLGVVSGDSTLHSGSQQMPSFSVMVKEVEVRGERQRAEVGVG
jgi:hypothetical protein